MNIRVIITLSFSVLCLSLFAGVNGTWDSTTDGSWSDTNNWVNGIIPFGKGQMATFNAANVSVTNDASQSVGVLKFNQGGINMYGNPLVLDATTPKIIVNSGIVYLRSPVVASNGLMVTKETYSDNRAHFYQRNEIGPNGLLVDWLRIKPHGADLAPLPGDGNVINSVFSTNTFQMTLARDGRYNQIGSQSYDTYQNFTSIYMQNKGYLEPYTDSSTFKSYITADELTGPGLLRVTGANGAVEFGSAARFVGSITYSGLDIGITGNAHTADLKPAAAAIMHLDASDTNSFVFQSENGTNFVTQWNSQVPGNYAKHDGYLTGGQRKLPWLKAGHLNGMAVVDFGDMKDLSTATRSAAPYLVWNTRKTTIKAAFAVLRSQNFIFTDTSEGHYHHSRLKSGDNYSWDQIMLISRGETHASFKNGEYVVSVNGVNVNPFSYQLSATQFDVVAMVVKEGASTVGTIAYDRAWRYGGQQVAEEIFYDRVLTDAEIEMTVAYLRNKWMDTTLDPVENQASAHMVEAVENGRIGLNIASNAVFAVDNVVGLGTREVKGSGTLRAERSTLRPEKPLDLNGGTLELVNDGPAVDTTLSSLNLSGMYFHLDASDLSSMTLDGNKVLEWRGESNVTNGLTAYAMNTADNPAPLLVPGRLNGLPVVDFGAWKSGKMMHWNHTNANIRTLFMVFDHIGRESFWLSNVYDGNRAHFHRDGAGIIFHTGYVAGGLTSGQTHINGKRVDQMTTYIPEEQPFLISFTCTDGQAAQAAVMASDRYPRTDLKYRSGDQRIAEVVVYNRHLSSSEREQVEGYLLRKWLPSAPAGFVSTDDATTFDGVSTETAAVVVGVSVSIGQDAVLGAADGAGSLEKTGAGTLAVGSLAGLSGELKIKEGALRVAQRALPNPYTLPGDIAFHVDASDSGSIYLDSDGTSITNISDASGGVRFATPANSSIPPQILPNELNGLPVISFLAADSGCAALWDQRVSKIRTVLWVIGSQDGGGMPLGTKENTDGSNFKRSPIGDYSDVIWASDSLAQYGVTRIHGAVVNGRTTGFNGGYQLMTLVTDRDCIASAFATHKSVELFGGQRLAEVIVYERLLLDQERRDVEAYLSNKWFGNPGSGYAGGDVDINHLNLDGGTFEMPEDVDVSIDSIAGTTDVIKDGSGILSVISLSDLNGAVVVSNGFFRLSGTPAMPELTTNGMLMHMDASITSSFDIVTENGTNFIARWDSLYGSHYAATNGVGKRPWILNDELNGLPVVDFGPYFRGNVADPATKGAYFDWDQEITNIRSGFFVLGSQDGGNFLVGSKTEGHFHRGYGSNEVSADAVIINEGRTETPDYLTSTGSYWSKDNIEIDAATTALSGGYESFCFITDSGDAPNNTVQGGTFARDRIYRYGGQRLAEFVIYDRALTEAERIDAEDYLRAKWFGEIPDGRYIDGSIPIIEVYGSGVVDVSGQEREVGTLRGNGIVSNGTLVVTSTLDVGGSLVDSLTMDNIELTSGSTIQVDISGSSADSVSVSDTVVFGTTGTVNLRGDASVGIYTLFTFSSIEGASNLSSWQVTGLPEGITGKLQVSGSTVVLTIHAQGTIIIMR